jgi:hypothetical protein
MHMSEPATMLTDYALALLSAFFALSLHLRSPVRKMSLWIIGFSVIALAALAGGTAHGFRTLLGETWGILRWITVFSIALGSALLIAAGIRSAIYPETLDLNARCIGHRWLKRAVEISLVGLVVLVLKLSPHPQFNHNDLYHVIQMGGLCSLYRAAILLGGLSDAGQSRKI